MRTIDLDLARELVGKFKLNGETYEVYEQTIGQVIQHTAEAKKANDLLNKLREEGNESEFVMKHAEWLIREIQIFVPSLKDDDIKGLSPIQRKSIMDLIFGVEEEKEEDTKLPQKKTKASPGEK